VIKFNQVTKTFPGGTTAVDNLSFEVPRGQTLVLLGTSGSGKTTTMKMVNRLIEPTSGSIEIDGSDIMSQNPIELRRNIGYAIQHIGLFPHMTVGENIAVIPKMLSWESARIKDRVDHLLEMVGLEPDEFRDRYPLQLSGGQKQRIGVGRALAADPPIVLMDEPFGALDPITREQLQDEFLELESEIKKTIIFVTHDIFEAVKMGEKVALLNEGRLVQLSEPAELIDNPANEFVENFLGQARFQLYLMTRTIKKLVTETNEEIVYRAETPHLNIRSNYVQALDIFKRTSVDKLPVLEGKRPVGILKRNDLFKAMAKIVSE
jgi:osmoprotectant transport system ATP-binding protein